MQEVPRVRSFGARAATACLVAGLFAANVSAQGFKFEQEPGSSRATSATDNAASSTVAMLTPDCLRKAQRQKTMVIIGEEQSDGRISAQQQNYGPHFHGINGRLQALGIQTYTPEQIQKQIAQAEIDAYFKNDPDAALGASGRLGARLVLRGLITSQASVNPVLRVNQVTVGMGFTLTASDGRALATAGARESAYAGPDVRGMALTLLDERADEVLSNLYTAYCQSVRDVPGKKRAAKP